jgi:hypothetical protein
MRLAKNILIFLFFISNIENLFSFADTVDINSMREQTRIVFERIVKSYGKQFPKNKRPILEFEGTEFKKIAEYLPPNKICITDTLIKLCFEKYKNNAPNALSGIIGHELTHYFEQHQSSTNGFIDSNSSEIIKILSFINVNKKELDEKEIDIANIAIRKIMEAQADRRGLFTAYVAGYNSFKYYPMILDDLYEWFQLSDKDLEWRYFDKKSRQQIANNQIVELKKLVPYFDAANLLTLTAKYDIASECYDYVSQNFPSREIYNNAAMTKIIQIYNLLDSTNSFYYKGNKLRLPLVIESNSRLDHRDLFTNKVRSGNLIDNDELFKKLVNSAKKDIQKAIDIDPEYFPALVNKFCLHLMINEKDSANNIMFIAQRIMKSPNDSINFNFMNGIYLIFNGNEKQGIEIFEKNKDVSSIAAFNYSVYKGFNTSEALNKPAILNNLKIAGNNIADAMGLDFKKIEPLKSSDNVKIDIGVYDAFEEWYALRVTNKNDNQSTYFLIANNKYDFNVSKELYIGNSKTNITDSIGIPDFNFSFGDSELFIYDRSGVILKFEENLVKGIVLF